MATAHREESLARVSRVALDGLNGHSTRVYPYDVDVFDLTSAPSAFRARVKRDGIAWTA